ncbi:MAG TPA: glycosyltransferase family 1 protein [Acidobacteriota bacterium]|jgi:glycosyltransferase involved in cell wall biosynthesis
MRIGIDATVIHGEKSGVATYTEELTLALARLFPQDEFIWFSNRAVETENNVPSNIRIERSRLVPTRTLWMQSALPALARAERVDVLHFTNSLAPLALSTPYLISIHDMSTRLLPSFHTWKKRKLWQALLPNAARKCKAIVAGSESAAADIRAAFPFAVGKIFVVPYAASPGFYPAAAGEDFGPALRALAVQSPYILGVGNMEPRKGFVTLLKAFQQLRQDQGIPHRLYLCGPSGWKNRILKKSLQSDNEGTARYLGYVSRQQLRALYCNADLFVYPSLMEGFGLPVLEAMSCGTAVIAAANSAITEVALNSARLFATHSVSDLRDALAELLGDPAEIERWRKLGQARAREFTWERAAAQTMEIYRRVAGMRR